MQQVETVKEILQGTRDSEQVNVHGWLQNKRTSGGIIFLILRDGTGIIQCTLRK
ncbi:MAG TPA: OB-fold nucleic acid binding domain-containing protein, partial [Candidatus Bathyarchaeia archaeon]|nr:OB-fold nucleic acid binding domain-containing protein [Candidatus Bathyarchaeia archaeon]